MAEQIQGLQQHVRRNQCRSATIGRDVHREINVSDLIYVLHGLQRQSIGRTRKRYERVRAAERPADASLGSEQSGRIATHQTGILCVELTYQVLAPIAVYVA